jgi:hypothetical protein
MGHGEVVFESVRDPGTEGLRAQWIILGAATQLLLEDTQQRGVLRFGHLRQGLLYQRAVFDARGVQHFVEAEGRVTE